MLRSAAAILAAGSGPHVGGFARPGVAMNGGHWGGGWGRGWGHGGFRHGFRGFGYGGLYAYAPYTYGYCDPYNSYAYAYANGACNGYAYVW